jgi:hypothetical protein
MAELNCLCGTLQHSLKKWPHITKQRTRKKEEEDNKEKTVLNSSTSLKEKKIQKMEGLKLKET